MTGSLRLKYPTKGRKYESVLYGRGVPRIAFRWRKLNLEDYFQPVIFETEKNQVYKTSVKQQQQAFGTLTRKLFKPRLTIIGTGAGGAGYPEAAQFVLWLLLQAYENRHLVSDREPFWYSIYNNRDNRLTRYYPDELSKTTLGIEDPSILVLDNLYANSGQASLNKAQDIINKYRYELPVYVLVNGTSGQEFSHKHLHIWANIYFQIGGVSQRVTSI